MGPMAAEPPETAAALAHLDHWAAAAASFGAKPDWCEEWQLLRACPITPPGRVLLVLGGVRGIHYLLVSRQLVRERHDAPDLLRLGGDAMKAASIVLYRRGAHPEQSPSPLLHLAYVAHEGRLQVVSYTAQPIVPSVVPGASGTSGTPDGARMSPEDALPSGTAPAAVVLVRLPGWLEWMRPAVTALLGVPPPTPPARSAASASSSAGTWPAPITGPLAS